MEHIMAQKVQTSTFWQNRKSRKIAKPQRFCIMSKEKPQ